MGGGGCQRWPISVWTWLPFIFCRMPSSVNVHYRKPIMEWRFLISITMQLDGRQCRFQFRCWVTYSHVAGRRKNWLTKKDCAFINLTFSYEISSIIVNMQVPIWAEISINQSSGMWILLSFLYFSSYWLTECRLQKGSFMLAARKPMWPFLNGHIGFILQISASSVQHWLFNPK